MNLGWPAAPLNVLRCLFSTFASFQDLSKLIVKFLILYHENLVNCLVSSASIINLPNISIVTAVF